MMAPPPAAPSVSPFVPTPGVPPPVAARPPPAPAPPRPAPPPAPQSPRAAAPPRPRPAAHRSTATPPGARRPQPWRPSAVFEHLPAVPPFARASTPRRWRSGTSARCTRVGASGRLARRAREDPSRARRSRGGFEPSRAAPAVASPAWLALKTYHVLALTKLRTFGGAADELRQLGNLDDPVQHGAERILSGAARAQDFGGGAPGLLGRPRETADALYALADRCAEDDEEPRRDSRRPIPPSRVRIPARARAVTRASGDAAATPRCTRR